MEIFSSLFFLSCLSVKATVVAQTFTDLPLPPSWPGISDGCVEALNSTVACPGFLGVVSVNNERLNAQNLSSLCSGTCHSSLNSVRRTIQAGCIEATDVIQYDGLKYPATFVIDRFLYTYSLACRRDPSTGDFCDKLLTQWLNEDISHDCSDCILGAAQTQLNSPFGYGDDFAADFASSTSSCGASNYSFTSPAPYALRESTTETSTAATPAPSSCDRTCVVQNGDTCNSIATANNVSTYSVTGPNGLLSSCDNLAPGSTLCLQGPCTLYQVQPEDTCASIIQAKAGAISDSQFLAWNPNINSLCGNLYSLKGTYICLSSPGGPFCNNQTTTTLAVSTRISAAPKPTNAPPESNPYCGRWRAIQAGDTCDRVSVRFGISLKDLYFLNPEINAACTNLLLDIAYCVQAVGDIATYSGYSTSQFFTLTSATYSTSVYTTPTDWPTISSTSTSQLPTAPGMASDCAVTRNYQDVPGVMDQSTDSQISLITSFINTCTYLAGTYGVSIDDLLKWNPSLQTENCALSPGFSYCMEQIISDSNSTIDTGNCAPVDNATTPSGTISTCSCFTWFYGYDRGSYECADIASDFKITAADLQSWNPWIGSDCDTGLYANLGDGDRRAVCVGVGGGQSSATTTLVPSTTTTTKTTTQSSSSMAPTQPGTIPSCTRFYTVQAGDSCAGVESEFGITFGQLYAWNPSIGADCGNLWLGYAYCVAAT